MGAGERGATRTRIAEHLKLHLGLNDDSRFNNVYEEEFFHSYDARIVEIFEIDQKL